MSGNLRLRLAPRPALHFRSSVRLQARFVESTGINVAYSGGIYTISIDWASLTAKASVTAPEQDNLFLALYDSDGLTYSKLGIDVLAAAIGGGGGGGAVGSVFGRTGVVTAQSGDYTAAQVANTPAGSISSGNVQAAINELDDDVSGHIGDTSGAHAASAISFSAGGSLSATDVQDAIEELRDEKQPLDDDLTAIAALTTTATGRSVLTVADPNLDRVAFWDDSAGTMKLAALADLATEASPAAGDFVLVQRAEDDVVKVNWADLPGAGGGISNVSEDPSPTLGGNLEGAGFSLGTAASQAADVFLEEGGVINWDNGDATITQTGNDITVAGITTFQLGTSTALTTGTIELGAASDTTISRASAGAIAVEGVEVTTNSGTQTLTNKTLTAPKIANAGFVADANGNEQIVFTTTASAVNEVTHINAATGNAPQINATGGDANVNLALAGKGTGRVTLDGFQAGVKLLTSGAFSTVSSVDIVLTAYTMFRAIKIVLTSVTPSTAARLFVRTSSNGGSSYDAGSSDYAWTENYSRDTTSTMIVESDSDDSEIDIGFLATSSGDHESIELTISGQTATLFTHIRADAEISNSGELYCFRGAGVRQSNADVDAIRILPSTGTISGSYAVYGLL